MEMTGNAQLRYEDNIEFENKHFFTVSVGEKQDRAY